MQNKILALRPLLDQGLAIIDAMKTPLSGGLDLNREDKINKYKIIIDYFNNELDKLKDKDFNNYNFFKKPNKNKRTNIINFKQKKYFRYI